MGVHSRRIVAEEAAPAGRRPRVLIIGAGVGGILMGIRLLQRGVRDFTILEKADDLGGTWRDNRYPGVACDIPAHLYTYSFEPNPTWTREFAGGAEIWRYYDRMARKYGVRPKMRFNEEATHAEWRGDHWQVQTASGQTFEADVLISACGRLHHPRYPEIEGLDSFAGPCFHTARWPKDLSLKGKRVGLIGTGSSATQIVIATADEVAKLSLFQRTAQWVLPVANPPIPWRQRLKFRLSRKTLQGHVDAKRAYLESTAGSIAHGRAKVKFRAAVEQPIGEIADPDLRARVTPSYEPGCKRIVMAPNFHQAVQKPSVSVVTEAIERVEPGGVRTVDGVLHELDILVLATGFKADWYMRPMTITGLDGAKLQDIWRDGPLNYRSIAIPQMPNLFVMNGPYSPGGTANIVDILEANAKYILQCLDYIHEKKVAIAPQRALSEELLKEIRGRASKTVWATGGCKSWYLDKEGVPLYNPLTIMELREQLATPAFADYDHIPLTANTKPTVVRAA